MAWLGLMGMLVMAWVVYIVPWGAVEWCQEYGLLYLVQFAAIGGLIFSTTRQGDG